MIASFILLQVIALICGIIGRRPVAGKIAIGFSATTLILGTVGAAFMIMYQLSRDFGGMPTLERLDAGAGKPPAMPVKIHPPATPQLLAEKPQLASWPGKTNGQRIGHAAPSTPMVRQQRTSPSYACSASCNRLSAQVGRLQANRTHASCTSGFLIRWSTSRV